MFVICIDIVRIPVMLIIVNMCHQKTMGVDWVSPFGELTVFEHIILVGVALVV